MALARCEFDATDELGNLLDGTSVSVEVRRESGGLPQLYSDRAGTVALGNPFIVTDGKVAFHVAGNAYKITLTAGALVRERRYVAVGLAGETDFTFARNSGVWDAGSTYNRGDYVIHEDTGIFISTADGNLNNEPDATTPGSTTHWTYYPGLAGPAGEPGIVGNWTGPWVTATGYNLADIAEFGGSSYYCVEAHTSGTFATDLAAGKWDLVAEKGDPGDGDVAEAVDRTALKALDTGAFTLAYLTEAGRAGMFAFDASDLSAEVAADALEGIYVAPASDSDGSSGAWVRQFDGPMNVQWFGTTGDDTSGDAARIQVALDLCGFLGGGRVYAPEGTYGLEAAIEHVANVYLEGAGYKTELHALGDYDVYTAIGSSGAGVINRGGLSNVLVRGGGKANTSAHGIRQAWTNRLIFRDIRFHSCRRAFDFNNVWQIVADNLQVYGDGSDQSYDGFYGREVDPSNQNNALIASGCVVQGVENDGYRLINFNGSKFTSCEAGACGRYGFYLGAPTTGTEAIRWGHFVNCLSDTCGNDCWRVEKGSASSVEQIQFTNCWAGTSAAGHGFHGLGTTQLVLTGFLIIATNKSGINFVNSSRNTISGCVIKGFDGASAANPGIRLENSLHMLVIGNEIFGSGTGQAIVETGTSDGNVIVGNDLSGVGAGLTVVGNATQYVANRGAESLHPSHFTVGAVAGSTYSGNIKLQGSDQFPVMTFRSAGSVKVQHLADVNAGAYYVDAPGGYNIRDTINGGTTIMSFAAARLTAGVPLKVKSFTVATLPAGQAGDLAYASNGRAMAGSTGAANITVQGAGAGTGCLVAHSGTNWQVATVVSTVAA